MTYNLQKFHIYLDHNWKYFENKLLLYLIQKFWQEIKIENQVEEKHVT